MFLYQLDWDEMQNPNNTAVKTAGTWTRITPWLPWMLMGPSEGHCTYSCLMGSGENLDGADPVAIAYAERHFPDFFEAPETWYGPSLSSLEWYSRQQTAAPLPASGEIPFAPTPDPQLPSW